MSFLIARNTTAGTGPMMSVSAFDQAIAALEPTLFCAMKANRRNGAAPLDRMGGEVWAGRTTGVPAVVENDAAFGHDVLKFTDVANSSTIVPKAGRALPASLTMGLVWAPDVAPATNTLGTIALLNNTGGDYGFQLFADTNNTLSLTPRFGVGALINLTGRVINGLNVSLVSIDAAGRTVGLFQNSTSAATGSGGPNPYTTPAITQNLNIGGRGIGTGDQAKVRIGVAFVLSEALHINSAGLLKARNLMEAAVRTYGVTLV